MAYSAMGYFLGIDGGGTHTTAWLADKDLSVVARVQAGPSNPIKVGLSSAQRELARAYRRAWREARVPPATLAGVCAGLAGGDGAPVQRSMLRWMRKAIPARAHLMTTDAAITLAAALGESPGIIVIAGTGSIAFGRDRRGRILRVGGWGNQFDDAGSGYDVGRKAIAAALRAHDGRGKRTSLAPAICRKLGLRKITEAVPLQLTPQNIAALFPAVQQEAEAGDATARRLCREAAEDLAELAATIIRRLRWKNRAVPVVCSGGVFRSSDLIRQAFARRIHRVAPRARVSLLEREPVEGALFLARRLLSPRDTNHPKA
ncbi:MAG TPA: BadF/BadG/BcrA/BcrD ATPase family protein [Terriglobia bacterium]|nr:BadF/BadG/BcrA/BcrD ATPase family protein [Terriglobia bacterium]